MKKKITPEQLATMILVEFGNAEPETNEEFGYNNAVFDIIKWLKRMNGIVIKIS